MYQRAVIRSNICKLKMQLTLTQLKYVSIDKLYEMLCHQLAFNEALK